MYVWTLCQVDVLFHTEWNLLEDPCIEYHLYHSKLENTESMCISMVLMLKVSRNDFVL